MYLRSNMSNVSIHGAEMGTFVYFFLCSLIEYEVHRKPNKLVNFVEEKKMSVKKMESCNSRIK